jgi:hypothetical protein
MAKVLLANTAANAKPKILVLIVAPFYADFSTFPLIHRFAPILGHLATQKLADLKPTFTATGEAMSQLSLRVPP